MMSRCQMTSVIHLAVPETGGGSRDGQLSSDRRDGGYGVSLVFQSASRRRDRAEPQAEIQKGIEGMLAVAYRLHGSLGTNSSGGRVSSLSCFSAAEAAGIQHILYLHARHEEVL